LTVSPTCYFGLFEEVGVALDLLDSSAGYGSWGILESMNHDFSEISAPKYKAMKDFIDKGLKKQ